MINIYDGNNVLMRAMTTQHVPGQVKLSIRQRIANTKGSDIYVWDGFDHNARRAALYPPYKAQRTPQAEDIFSQIKLFKELLTMTDAVQITCDGWESDDVIATLAAQGRRMAIHTNDLDYAQLRRFSNVTLVGVKAWDYDPKWLPLYKALVGDPADNIQGIPGFGQKAWEAILPYLEDMSSAIVLGSPHAFEHLPLRPQIKNWLASAENLDTLKAMYAITHFITVPGDEIAAGMTVGKSDPVAIDALLKRYFL